MNKLVEQHLKNQLPSDPEADRLLREAEKDAGFDKFLIFKKGYYYDSDKQQVDCGTEFIAHAEAYAKSWTHWRNQTMMDRKIYRVSDGRVIPEREDLDDRDQSTWEMGLDGRPQDPWVLQLLLPLEDPQTGEVMIFTVRSFGGKRAVSDLVRTYARRRARGEPGLPLIKLEATQFPSKKFGMVDQPSLKIIGWGDVAGPTPAKTIDVEGAAKRAEFDDEVPF